MTLDDLVKTFDASFEAKGAENERAGSRNLVRDCNRAGIRAVVAALRDFTLEYVGDVPAGQSAMKFMFNAILGSDAGNEKAAGETPERDVGKDLSTLPGLTPAADPSPAVCEWTLDTHLDDGSHYETACGDAWCSVLGGTPAQDNYSFCPSCGRPITFKEPTR